MLSCFSPACNLETCGSTIPNGIWLSLLFPKWTPRLSGFEQDKVIPELMKFAEATEIPQGGAPLDGSI